MYEFPVEEQGNPESRALDSLSTTSKNTPTRPAKFLHEWPPYVVQVQRVQRGRTILRSTDQRSFALIGLTVRQLV